MGLNKTQCPHCFTTYVISDEQFRVSEGMVRCGTCRERFQARLIGDSPSNPRFDPRDAFIEPLSEEPTPATTSPSPITTEIRFTEPRTESNNQATGFTPFYLEESIDSELSIDMDDDATAKGNPNIEAAETESSDISNRIETPSVAVVMASINAQRVRNQPGAEPQEEVRAPTALADAASQAEEAQAYQVPSTTQAQDKSEAKQTELELPLRDPTPPAKKSAKTPPELNRSSHQSTQSNQMAESRSDTELVDEVDTLIKDKILSPRSNTISAPPVARRRTRLAAAAPASRKKPAFRWFLVIGGLLTILLLVATLLYQLWLKQWIKADTSSRFEDIMQIVIDPLADRLAERNVELPVRRNLNQLELISARTETHPTRPSTTLLRVSLINRATIMQPLPWLELSLRDSEGQLVSRRKLSPRDYLYNNKTTTNIGASELKKVTIELLAFPKQATGYELKIIDQ